jgi:cyclopropane-fatty-acyl-phospholipid synthase
MLLLQLWDPETPLLRFLGRLRLSRAGDLGYHSSQSLSISGFAVEEGAMTSNATVSNSNAAGAALHLLEQLANRVPGNGYGVRLWDGTQWGAVERPRFTIVLKNPAALRHLLLSPSELSLGEAFIYDDFDVEGDLQAAFEFAEKLLAAPMPVSARLKLRAIAAAPRRFLGQRSAAALAGGVHSKQRDRDAIAYHYDLPSEFYALFLDRQMTYSCAYFRSPDDDLDTAQEQKLDYICRKLRLKPQERLLDIGCGWGGLLIHAVKNYGVRGLGITLSAAQAETARLRIHDAGVADRCQVEIRDYRDLQQAEPFDKLVSVGMFEHVGEALLPEYFGQAWRLLRAQGLFLNHGIAASATYQRKGPSFVEKYVFPDGELVPLFTTVRAAEGCGFEVCDVENLRPHYVLTLQHWVKRLEARATEARRLTDEVAYRTWRIYMAGSAHGFRHGRMNLYQLLLSKSERGQTQLPLTREDWYEHSARPGAAGPT